MSVRKLAHCDRVADGVVSPPHMHRQIELRRLASTVRISMLGLLAIPPAAVFASHLAHAFTLPFAPAAFAMSCQAAFMTPLTRSASPAARSCSR